jgi:hypothetical protein
MRVRVPHHRLRFLRILRLLRLLKLLRLNEASGHRDPQESPQPCVRTGA